MKVSENLLENMKTSCVKQVTVKKLEMYVKTITNFAKRKI